MELTIEAISRKDVQTSRGPAVKVGIKCRGEWYSAFEGNWNKHWNRGITVTIDDAQITERVVDGRVFKNIGAPKGQNGNPSTGDLSVVLSKLENIERMVCDLVHKLIPYEE
jgi:hypothetical protein